MKKYIFCGAVVVLLVHLADTCLAITGVIGMGTNYLVYDVENQENARKFGAACNNVELNAVYALFINPSNVGVRNKQSKNAVLGFVNEDEIVHTPQVCIREEAHLNAAATAASSLGYSWLSINPDVLDGTVTQYSMQRFTDYTCNLVSFGLPSHDDTNSVLITSLRRVLPSVFTRTEILHYDIVWVTAMLQDSYKVCWQNVETRTASHPAIFVDTLEISQTVDNSAGYVAGKVEFAWPGGDAHSGFCLIVPFATPWEIPPVMFATLENPGAENLDTDQTAGVFIWVEDVSSGTFEVCGSHITSITANIRMNSPFKIHYFGMPVAIPGEGPRTVPTAATLTLAVSAVCDNHQSEIKYTCDFGTENSHQTQLFLDWLAEGLEIPREHLNLIDSTLFGIFFGHETSAEYVVSWSSMDPQMEYDKFESKINAEHDNERGIVDYESAVWDSYLSLVNQDDISHPDDKITEFHITPTLKILCTNAFSAEQCSKQCDEGKSGSVNLVPSCDYVNSQIVECNVAPCSGSQEIYSLSIEDEVLISDKGGGSPPPDNGENGSGSSSASVGSSNAPMIATIAMGVLLAVVIIGIVIVIILSREKSTTFGNIGAVSANL